MFLIVLLQACDSTATVKGTVTVETNTPPTVSIMTPVGGDISPIFTTVPCTGMVYDEIESLSSDTYVWLLDEVEIGRGAVSASGEVSGSFTLTDYEQHVLELRVNDQSGILTSDFLLVDAGEAPDSDGDGVEDSVDCNPTNSELYLMGSWYPDEDKDGYGSTTGFQSCGPWDGYVTDPSLATDCNDRRGDTHPGASEVCNGRDDDCDGTVDNQAVDAQTWYTDSDGDGWGDSSTAKIRCTSIAGDVATSGDCDDGDPAIHPEAAEHCGGTQDLDCDGVIGGTLWYRDLDFDGYGDSSVISTYTGCTKPDGYVSSSNDCDDNRATVNPGASEVCDPNDIDEDCDGQSDDNDPSTINRTLWSNDYDQDGFGDWAMQATSCDAPAGYILDASDCNDFDGQTFPGASEKCDNRDNNCDGTTDENAVDALLWYADGDGDGFGDGGRTQLSCSQPAAYVANADDCDDAAAGINPNTVWYVDRDIDGYGDAGNTTTSCLQPKGYVGDSSDCNDGDPKINPTIRETCDGVDQDCDGGVDEEVPDDSYELAGSTPYALTGTSVTGWFSSTDTTGEDWYTFSVSSAGFVKKVNISYSGPNGHVVTISADGVTTLVTSASPFSKTVPTYATMVFTIQILADSTLSDTDLCISPYTLKIY